MTFLPLKRDDNDHLMEGVWTDSLGDVRSLDTNWLAIQFPVDVKGLAISVDSGTVYLKGTQASSLAWLNASAIVDNGDGTVTIAATGHGFTDNDDVTFPTLTDYPGTYTVLAAGDADNIVVTATYVAKTPAATDYAVGYRYPSRASTQEPFILPVGRPALTTICYLKAATTAVVSIIAWR